MKGILILGAMALTLLLSGVAMAQDHGTAAGASDASKASSFWVIPGEKAGVAVGVSLGAGIIVLGAAKGIGNIGASAVEAIARQPEAGGRIFTSMLLSAALIEGFTFFALLVPFLSK